MSHDHFKGKEAIDHVAERQAAGLIAKSEIHGTELPGHKSAGYDAAKETAAFFLILFPFLPPTPPLFAALGMSLVFWKMGRSAFLGWSRLERLHRILEQERWEIEHHRTQEREELKELYRAKGFEGKLLEDVTDVLMADGDRLLRVMVEEELGLSLESQEHPLKQSLGAAFGAVSATLLALVGIWLNPQYGLIIASFATIGASSALSAHYLQNNVVSSLIWNLGIGALSFGTAHFLKQIIAL